MSLSKSLIYRLASSASLAGRAEASSRRLPQLQLSQLLPSSAAAAINMQQLRFKGHSKWQNIAATKGANDARLAKIAAKYNWKIRTAIRTNGNQTDMARNRELERAFKAGLSEGVSKSTLEKAIKNATGAGTDMVESLQEVRGPGNSFILVEMLTKSVRQGTSEVVKVTSKKGGMLDKGILNMFEKRGRIVAKPPPEVANGYNTDKAEEDAIEMGAEEAEVDEGGVVEFLCGPFDFPEVRSKAEEMNFEVLDASVAYIPSQWLELEREKDRAGFTKLIEALDDNQFVTAVHHNVLPFEEETEDD